MSLEMSAQNSRGPPGSVSGRGNRHFQPFQPHTATQPRFSGRHAFVDMNIDLCQIWDWDRANHKVCEIHMSCIA